MIGERVRKYRRQKGLSQEQLGAIVGFSQSKISKIENGDWDSLSDLRLIAKVLEVPIEELVREEAESSDRAYKGKLPANWAKRCEHWYTEFERVEAGAEAWRQGNWLGSLTMPWRRIPLAQCDIMKQMRVG